MGVNKGMSNPVVRRGMLLLGSFYGTYFGIGFLYPVVAEEKLTATLSRTMGVEVDPKNTCSEESSSPGR